MATMTDPLGPATSQWFRGIQDRLPANSASLLVNSGSMVGTTAANSLLGFFYWAAAGRLFAMDAVGLASAGVSAMMFLGYLGRVGLGTWLLGELPRTTKSRGTLISTALILSGAVGGVLGLLFAVLVPLFADNLTPLTNGPLNAAVFAVGVALTAAVLVLDQAVIGLLRGALQFWRNNAFALGKLVILVVLGLMGPLTAQTGTGIYATWLAGNGLSLILLSVLLQRQGHRVLFPVSLSALSGRRRSVLTHHGLDMVMLGPGFLLPVLAATLLSPSIAASFYAAWMIASLGFMVPLHLSTVLFTVGKQSPDLLPSRFRVSLGASVGLSLIAALGLLVVAGLLLSLFGEAYREQAATCLRVIAWGALPLTVKYHYITLERIRSRMSLAIVVVGFGALLEIGLASIGAVQYGLTGLGAGWLVACVLEAVLFGGLLLRAYRQL